MPEGALTETKEVSLFVLMLPVNPEKWPRAQADAGRSVRARGKRHVSRQVCPAQGARGAE